MDRRKGKRGIGSRNKTIVYGSLERRGNVWVSIIGDVPAESLMKETIKKVRRGSIVYTDKWRGSDSLMFCASKHQNINHSHMFKLGKVYINGIEGFWSFTKERLFKYHLVNTDKFPLYIKELEFSSNNRCKDLFSLLVDYITMKKIPGVELN